MQLNMRILEEKGLKLLPAPTPVGSYVQCIRTGNLLHLSGGISVNGESSFYGKLGRDLAVEEGQKAAEAAILNRLAVIQWGFGPPCGALRTGGSAFSLSSRGGESSPRRSCRDQYDR